MNTLVPEFVALSDGNENDMVEGRKFRFPKGSIVAFDKGYVDYEWFGSLTGQGVSCGHACEQKPYIVFMRGGMLLRIPV